jgi:hypothetical protein
MKNIGINHRNSVVILTRWTLTLQSYMRVREIHLFENFDEISIAKDGKSLILY